jgi:flavin reductase (DIM6/NTAB) family NADH-FMN oxidoreductase RutF
MMTAMASSASVARRDFVISDLEPSAAYALTTTCLIPRPIAWVSTVSAGGADNVAPHSFTTVAGVDPLTVCFTSVGVKDTLRNTRATGEFVLNIGGQWQVAAINDSATALHEGRSEFDEAGIGREPSVSVKPPRVAGAPVCFECRVSGEHSIGDSHMVFGAVLHVAVAEHVLGPDGHPDPTLLAPVSRLGRNQWATLGEVFGLDRIGADSWQAGRRSEPPALDAT